MFRLRYGPSLGKTYMGLVISEGNWVNIFFFGDLISIRE